MPVLPFESDVESDRGGLFGSREHSPDDPAIRLSTLPPLWAAVASASGTTLRENDAAQVCAAVTSNGLNKETADRWKHMGMLLGRPDLPMATRDHCPNSSLFRSPLTALFKNPETQSTPPRRSDLKEERLAPIKRLALSLTHNRDSNRVCCFRTNIRKTTVVPNSNSLTQSRAVEARPGRKQRNAPVWSKNGQYSLGLPALASRASSTCCAGQWRDVCAARRRSGVAQRPRRCLIRPVLGRCRCN